MDYRTKRRGKTINTGTGWQEKGDLSERFRRKTEDEEAAVTWFARFGRLDQLDWLTIMLAVLAGTLAKQRHFLDFPGWFLDWVFPFLLIIAGYKARQRITEMLETRRKNERYSSGE